MPFLTGLSTFGVSAWSQAAGDAYLSGRLNPSSPLGLIATADPSQSRFCRASNGEIGGGGVFRGLSHEEVLRRMKDSLGKTMDATRDSAERVKALGSYYDLSSSLTPGSREFAEAVEILLLLGFSSETSSVAELRAAHFALDWVSLLERVPPDAWEGSYSESLIELIRGPWLPFIAPRLERLTPENNLVRDMTRNHYVKEGILYVDCHRPHARQAQFMLLESLQRLPDGSRLRDQTQALLNFLRRQGTPGQLDRVAWDRARLREGLEGLRPLLDHISDPEVFGDRRWREILLCCGIVLSGLQFGAWETDLLNHLFVTLALLSMSGLPLGAAVVGRLDGYYFLQPLQKRWDQALKGFEELDFVEQLDAQRSHQLLGDIPPVKVRVPPAEADTADEAEEIKAPATPDHEKRRRRS